MKVLIIEDDRQERHYARKLLESLGAEVVVATVASDVWPEGVEAVITDLYMPFAEPASSVQESWRTADNPTGLLNVVRAIKKGLPVSVCTSEYHHGRCQWVANICGELDVPYIDEKVSDHKDWERAFYSLKIQSLKK